MALHRCPKCGHIFWVTLFVDPAPSPFRPEPPVPCEKCGTLSPGLIHGTLKKWFKKK